ncbi:hypothetical protein N307_07263, partial [Dryobates pubescens]
KGGQYQWNQLPQAWVHSSTICHEVIQTALEKGGAPEHLQFTNDIIVWGETAEEVYQKGKRIIDILLEAGFAIKRSKVKGPAREIQFLGVQWQDGRRHIPQEVVNRVATVVHPKNKKETQSFLWLVGFWKMHIPGYSQIVKPLFHVSSNLVYYYYYKNDFVWGPEQQVVFSQIKREVVQAMALGPVQTGPEVKNVLYTVASENGPMWSLWQKPPGETRGRPLGF